MPTARKVRGRPPSAVARRSAARLAAVQALYQQLQTGQDPGRIIAEFGKHRVGRNLDGEDAVPPDPDLFRAIVLGTSDNRRRVNETITEQLDGERKAERLDLILQAILGAGTWELLEKEADEAVVAVSDYIHVAEAFFGGKEPAMVNAVLDRLRRRRAAEDAERGPAPG